MGPHVSGLPRRSWSLCDRQPLRPFVSTIVSSDSIYRSRQHCARRRTNLIISSKVRHPCFRVSCPTQLSFATFLSSDNVSVTCLEQAHEGGSARVDDARSHIHDSSCRWTGYTHTNKQRTVELLQYNPDCCRKVRCDDSPVRKLKNFIS